ncbi:hypothetical protein C0992_004922 [Termitomyces sp. T32_za158]|nr:hypothetical protein C0992_004922 [Termitomyces sp. T32_za158]
MHRPADSRLLSNLVTHEKDYAKSLKTLRSPSHALSAYAAACAPPLPNALLQVSAALGEADEALVRYADAVEECREHLARIEELEDDLGVVVRDREILCRKQDEAVRMHDLLLHERDKFQEWHETQDDEVDRLQAQLARAVGLGEAAGPAVITAAEIDELAQGLQEAHKLEGWWHKWLLCEVAGARDKVLRKRP